jgi:glycine/D-amino acid oxidase-like deaminating enzyme
VPLSDLRRIEELRSRSRDQMITPVRVIVAGAGIAGLSAAIALRRTDNEAVVLERAPPLTRLAPESLSSRMR